MVKITLFTCPKCRKVSNVKAKIDGFKSVEAISVFGICVHCNARIRVLLFKDDDQPEVFLEDENDYFG